MGLARGSLSCAVVLLMALVSLAPAVLAEGLSQRDRKRLRFEIEQDMDRKHLRRDAVDLEAVIDEVDRALEAGAPRKDIGRLAREALNRLGMEALRRSLLDFAGRGAQPKLDFKYRYPLDMRVPRLIVQGPGDAFSHEGIHAYDFATALGTPVLAARPGRVLSVIDGFTETALPEDLSWKCNVVRIMHRDGTVASYAHLSPGIRVSEGQDVKGGEWIANSGNSGYSASPHVHFEVSRLDEAGEPQSVPIRFRDGTPQGKIPEAFEWLVGRPPATVKLRVWFGERLVRKGEPVDVTLGDRGRLRVELLSRAGGFVDVSNDRHTKFVSASPWLVDVSDFGYLHFRRDPDWTGGLSIAIYATVSVIFEDPERGALGFFDIRYKVADPALETSPG
jgi:murein DD-endopeptidase MepM/ murein hydrolase activator NlpD